MNKWYDKLKNNIKIHPIPNKYLSPVPILKTLEAIDILINKKYAGFFHLSSSDEIDYIKVAKILIQSFSFKYSLLLINNNHINNKYHDFTTLKNSHIFKKILRIKSNAVIEQLIIQYL